MWVHIEKELYIEKKKKEWIEERNFRKFYPSINNRNIREFLAAQWLRLCASTAADMHSIPDGGTK